MKLGDLTWRSALRGRRAREVEITEQYVFEVENLTIPAGSTDDIWLGDAVPLPATRRILWNAYIELAEPVPVGQHVGLIAYLTSGNAEAGVSDPPDISDGNIWDWSKGEFNVADYLWGTVQTPIDGDGRWVVRPQFAGPEIVVTRVHAAFLII